MPDLSKDKVFDALRQVVDPQSGHDIVSLGAVSGLVVRGNHVGFSLEADPKRAPQMEPLRRAAETAVLAIPGVEKATVVLTAHHDTPANVPQKGERRGLRVQPAQKTPTRPQSAAPGGSQGPQAPQAPQGIPGVRHIVAVASGKGGVGKSTVAVNLALALAKSGLATGLLDADVYGPSVPRLLNITDSPESLGGKKLKPIEAYGIKAMSIGMLVDTDTPMIWRGPMVMSALTQMLQDVAWAPLDVLVVDMPPGTGDAQLTLAQRVPLSGAVVVSTPQEIALIDARKGLAMFERTRVPVFGIIENMAYFVAPGSHEKSYIFGEGGARRTAETLGCDFLGEIPLYMSIRETSDAGTPIVATRPDSEEAKPFLEIADKVRAKLENRHRQPPRIVVAD